MEFSEESGGGGVQRHLYLWVDGNTVVVICFEEVGRNCEDLVNGDALLTRKGGWLRNGEVRTEGGTERKQTNGNSTGRSGGMIQVMQAEGRSVKQHNPPSRWRASLAGFSGIGFW
jgi:hypothetical protein